MAFIDAHNDNPYKWVKSADEIRASVKRFCLKQSTELRFRAIRVISILSNIINIMRILILYM